MKGIYKFYVDCGRNGDIQGVFVADSVDIEKVIGKDIYFGEILGKHSEVRFEIDVEMLQLVTQDEAFIALFENYEIASGINPLNYCEATGGIPGW